MGFLTLFAVCALQIAAHVYGEGHYSIIAPGTIHPEHKYSVAVGVHDTTAPCQMKIGIIGPDYSDTKTIELKTNEIKTIDFEVPLSKKEGDYNITAEGLSGLVFKNTTKLNYKIFEPYVRIQTDKGKYKPGDLVNFRVLFLDENLKPAKPREDVYLWIEDAKRNRLKEYKNLNVVKGVYTDKFQLSDYAILGGWRLIVKNGADYYNPTAYFDVEKYVLPKYSVKVEATEEVSVRDGDLTVVVRANYTYGKPVNAKVHLILNMDNSFAYYDKPESERKTAPLTIKNADMVEGKAKFDLNVKDYADYMPNNGSSYSASITATVEENFTGVKINGSTYTTLYPYRYKIQCADWTYCSSFKADTEFEIPIKVLHVDNSKVDEKNAIVKLHFYEVLTKNNWYRADEGETTTTTLMPPISENKEFHFESQLNASSMAPIKVKLDDLKEYEGYSHYYQVKAEFIDETHEVFTVFQSREPKMVDTESDPKKEPTEWFLVETHYEKDKWNTDIGKPIMISINSSASMPYFVYHITGRGNVLHTERVELAETKKLHNLTITPTFMMSPYSTVYIYFIDEHGEFHYGETSLSVEVALQNQIELITPDEVKPGDEVNLKIKTPAHSFVGLLAVDQSVLLLGGNNDIEPEDFRWRLGGYSTMTPPQGGYSYYPGQHSGLVTLTNGDYFYNWTKPDWAGGSFANRKAFHSTPAVAMDAESDVMRSDSAGAAGGAGGGAGGDIRVRKNFEETWIFADIEDTQGEEFSWTKQIPDTITSWVVSAFSINDEKGLGVTKERSKIRTFQPFFVSPRLPYAVKRGEVINVNALVSNYLPKDLDVEVTLENTYNEYEFVEPTNQVINEPKRTKSVNVPRNSARGVSFMLRTKALGNIMLKFTAKSPIAGDAIHRTLKVVPEGVTQYANRAYFVNLKGEPEFKQSFELNLPNDVVPDSQHIEFGLIGDILGPVINNLDNMLRMPLGCGEQVTSTLLPNYLVLKYLNQTHKLTDAVERKIKRNLEQGYQHLLNYRNDDGSFSSFHWLRSQQKRNGSTWLTAYVVRTLNKLTQVVEVDKKIINEGFDYLVKQQAENGSFPEAGDYFYASQNQHLSRTASVLLAFIENEEMSKKHADVAEKAKKYIEAEDEKNENLETKALVAFVLHQAKHAAAPAKIQALKVKAQTDEDRMWWSDVEHKKSDWWRWSFSSEVETTAYILLVLLDMENENAQTVLPIVKWLVAQRNSNGGFSSTHDTVVGLQALIKFAEKSDYEAADMTVDFEAKGSEKKGTLKASNDNDLLLQTVELPQKTTGVDFHAIGKGAALIQVAYQYNIVERDQAPSFTVDAIVNKEAPAHKLDLEVCVEFTGDAEASNMAVVEVPLPSGYVADVENFEEIEKVDGVSLTETKDKETVVVVYFDSLPKDQKRCLPVVAYRQYPVALQKPVHITVYDYYDTARKGSNTYTTSSKLCDICEDDEECQNVCK